MMHKSWIILVISVTCFGKTAMSAAVVKEPDSHNFVFKAKQRFVMESCGELQEEDAQPISTEDPTPSCEQELEATIKIFEDELQMLNGKWYDFLIEIDGRMLTEEFYNQTLKWMSEMSQLKQRTNHTWVESVKTKECTDQIIAFNGSIHKLISHKNDMPAFNESIHVKPCEQDVKATIQILKDEIQKLNRKWNDFLIDINGRNLTEEFDNKKIEYMSELSQLKNHTNNTWIESVMTKECPDIIIALNERIDEIISFKNDMPAFSTHSTNGTLITKVTLQPSATSAEPQEVSITTTPHQ